MVDRPFYTSRETSERGDAFDDEPQIPLYETSREREFYDEQANLYAIIVATEHLERAYARDAIDPKEYTAQCKKLISQFKLAERVLKDGMTTETFMALYQMDCPRAEERLLKMGIPEPMKGGTDEASHAVTVAETVQHFITTMDAVKLDQRAVDELQPLLSDLNDVITRVPDTPNDFEPNRKIQKWLQKLNAMRAVDEISDEDSRQLYHDLDSAYTEFTRYLKRGGN
jgi:ESCRT-I complex subunit VPS28